MFKENIQFINHSINLIFLTFLDHPHPQWMMDVHPLHLIFLFTFTIFYFSCQFVKNKKYAKET